MVLPPRMLEFPASAHRRDRREQLGAAETDEELDLIDQFAFPLTIIVITELLCLAAGDRAQLKRWEGVLVAAPECKRTAEAYDPANAVAVEVFAFFHEQIEQRRRDQERHRPMRPGLLSDLPSLHDHDGDHLVARPPDLRGASPCRDQPPTQMGTAISIMIFTTILWNWSAGVIARGSGIASNRRTTCICVSPPLYGP